MALPENIHINGADYVVANLSEAARTQIVNIQAVDAEISRLQMRLGIAQTARNAYVGALTVAMPEVAQAAAQPVQADAADADK